MNQLTDFLPKEKPDVQYFDEFKGELTKDQRDKAEKFLEYDCVRYIGDGKFICLPLNQDTEAFFCGTWYVKKPYIGYYNSRTYLLTKDPVFGWRCHICQGYHTKEKTFQAGLSPNPPFCSHLLALMHAFKDKLFDGGEHG